MGWSATVTIVTIGIAFVSLGVSIWAVVESKKANRRSLKTNHKMLEIEQQREKERQDKEQRANITTKFEHLQQQGHYVLQIKNNGASEGRDVKVVLGEKPISEFRNIDPKIPRIPMIGPGSSVSYTWPCANNSCPPLFLEITWSDDSKKLGHYSTTLTHPRKPT